MFCNKCGIELPGGASFCTTCGAQQIRPVDDSEAAPSLEDGDITSPKISTPSQTPDEPVNKPKKKGVFLKILAVFVLVVALISGVTVLGYYTFLPAKTTLLIAEYASVVKNYNAFDKFITLIDEKSYKPIYENSVKKDSELSLSTDAASLEQFGLPTETTDLIIKGLHNISIKYGYSMDAKNKKETVDLGLSLQNNPLLTANIFMDDTKFGLGVPELFQKTIVGDFKSLDKLAEVFPDIDPVLLESYKNMDPWMSVRIYNEVKIDRKDIKKFMIDYSKELINSVDSDDMSIKRGQSTLVLDKELKCQEVTIKLDQASQKEVVSKILTKLQDDQNTFDLTVGNLNKILDILGENEMYKQMFTEIGIEDAISKEDYKQALVDFEASIDETSLPQELTVKAYIKGLDIVKVDFSFATDSPDNHVAFIIENSSKDLSFDQKYTLSTVTDGNSSNLVVDLKNDYDESSDTSDFNADFNMDMNMPDSVGSVNFVISSTEDPNGKSDVNHTVDSTLSFDITSYEAPEQGEITFKLTGTKSRNDKKLVTASSYTGDIGLSMPDTISNPVNIGFAVNTTTEYGKAVTIPELTEDEILDIAVAEQEDYEELMSEIYEKIGSLAVMLGSL